MMGLFRMVVVAVWVGAAAGLSELQEKLNECCIDPDKGFKEYLKLC